MPRNPIAALALAGLLASGPFAHAKPPVAAEACTPVPPRRVVETFLSADCPLCWQRASAEPAAAARTLRLDWIVPGRQGDEAPLASAALPEAGERLKRPLAPDADAVQRQDLPAPPAGVRLAVQSGLAWNGYVAVSFNLQRGRTPLPPDARGWLALVERVPAGQDGTPVGRQLVRTLVGPLPLDAVSAQGRLQHLRAVQLPANSQPERLAAVGWIDQPGGRMLLAAQSPAAGCGN